MPFTLNAQDLSRLTDEQKKEFLNKNFEGVLRGFVWDLPPTLILENEKGTFVGEEDGRLFYIDDIQIGDVEDEVKTVRATIGYEFIEDQLWRARVFIEKNYLDHQERIRDLMRIRQNMVEQYGEPIDEIMVWHDKKELNWPDSWGWAVLRGELMMTMIFENKETRVEVFLGARQKLNPNLKDPEFNITYINLERMEEVEKRKDEDFLSLP